MTALTRPKSLDTIVQVAVVFLSITSNQIQGNSNHFKLLNQTKTTWQVYKFRSHDLLRFGISSLHLESVSTSSSCFNSTASHPHSSVELFQLSGDTLSTTRIQHPVVCIVSCPDWSRAPQLSRSQGVCTSPLSHQGPVQVAQQLWCYVEVDVFVIAVKHCDDWHNQWHFPAISCAQIICDPLKLQLDPLQV